MLVSFSGTYVSKLPKCEASAGCFPATRASPPTPCRRTLWICLHLQNAQTDGPYTAYTHYFGIMGRDFGHFGGPVAHCGGLETYSGRNLLDTMNTHPQAPFRSQKRLSLGPLLFHIIVLSILCASSIHSPPEFLQLPGPVLHFQIPAYCANQTPNPSFFRSLHKSREALVD